MNFQPVNLTLGNGDSAGTFMPDSRNGNVFSFIEQDAPSMATADVLSTSITKPTKSQKYYKVRIKLVDNVSKTAIDSNGVLQETGVFDHLNSADVVLQFSSNSTKLERLATYNRMMAILSNAVVGTQAVDLQSLY